MALSQSDANQLVRAARHSAEAEADVRPLFIGEAPSKMSDPSVVFHGRSGTRLTGLLGTDAETFRSRFRLVNLFASYEELPRGRWDSAAAFARAQDLRDSLVRSPLVILCGRRVAAAFCFDRGYFSPAETFAIFDDETPTVASVMPHPSALSRWWNEPTNVDQATVWLRNHLAGALS